MYKIKNNPVNKKKHSLSCNGRAYYRYWKYCKIRAAFLDVCSLDKILQILKTKTSVNKLKTVFIKGIKIIFSSKMK